MIFVLIDKWPLDSISLRNKMPSRKPNKQPGDSKFIAQSGWKILYWLKVLLQTYLLCSFQKGNMQKPSNLCAMSKISHEGQGHWEGYKSHSPIVLHSSVKSLRLSISFFNLHVHLLNRLIFLSSKRYMFINFFYFRSLVRREKVTDIVLLWMDLLFSFVFLK